jgi:hypothetical protein
MGFLVKSRSLGQTYGPYDTLLEAQKEAQVMEAAMRDNGLMPDVLIEKTGPIRPTAISERGKQGGKQPTRSGGGGTARKKNHKQNRKRGSK